MAQMNDKWFKIEHLSEKGRIYWFTGPALGVFLGKASGVKKGKVFDLDLGMWVEGATHFQFLERPKDVDPKEWQKAWTQFDRREEKVSRA